MQYSRVGLNVSTPEHLNSLVVDSSLNVQPVSQVMVRGCAFEPEDVVPLTGFILAICPVDWSDSEGSVHTAEIETQLKTDI